MLQKNIAFVTLLSEFSAAAPGWTATVQQTVVPWVPETEGQLKTLHQFTSIKNGAAIKTTLATADGLVKSSGSGSGSRSGSGESASKKQRTADTRDVTSLEAAAFATVDKSDVPYGADALKEQQLYKLYKLAKVAKKAAATAAAQAAKKAAKEVKKAAKKAAQAAKEAAKTRRWVVPSAEGEVLTEAQQRRKAQGRRVLTEAQQRHQSNKQNERRAGRTKEKKNDDNQRRRDARVQRGPPRNSEIYKSRRRRGGGPQQEPLSPLSPRCTPFSTPQQKTRYTACNDTLGDLLEQENCDVDKLLTRRSLRRTPELLCDSPLTPLPCDSWAGGIEHVDIDTFYLW
jgi:hypothetical protein